MNSLIPKNIFQLWKTKQVPFHLRPYVSTWNRLAGYQYRLYDDDEMDAFVATHYPDFYTDYRPLVPVEKTDIFRLMLIYEYGGMYTDIDTSLNCDLNKLYASYAMAKVLLGMDTDTTEQEAKDQQLDYTYAVCNWTFAACPKHPFIKAAIDKVIYNICNNPHLYTTFKTGPIPLTDVYRERKNESDVVVLPIQYFGAGQRHSGSPPLSEGYILHHFLHSWTGKRRSWMNKFFYWYRSFFRRV